MSTAEPRQPSDDNLVPLIKQRKTLIRVYFTKRGPYRARLHVSSSPEGLEKTLFSLNDGRAVGKPKKRELLSRSLNFEVPDDLLEGDSIIIHSLSVVDTAGNPHPSFTCGNCSTYQAIKRPLMDNFPLRLRLIGLSYATEKNGRKKTYAPTEQEFKRILSWLRRTYPVSQILLSPTPREGAPILDIVPYDGQTHELLDDEDGCQYANKQLRLIRQLDIDGASDVDERQKLERTRYIGILSDKGFPKGVFIGGCASSHPEIRADIVATAPVGQTTRKLFNWDEDGFYGDWQVAHELGHTFGRKHPKQPDLCGAEAYEEESDARISPGLPTTTRYLGLDFGDQLVSKAAPRIIPGNWYEFMSYCASQNPERSKWINSHSYQKIYEALTQDNLSTQAHALVSNLAEAKSRFVTFTALATINLSTNKGSLDYVRQTASTEATSPHDREPDKRQAKLRITFRKGDQITLPMQIQVPPADIGSQRIAMARVHVTLPIQSLDAPISDQPARVAKVELLVNDTVTEEIVPASRPPIVKIDSPPPLDPHEVQAGKPLPLKWTVDPPGEDPNTNINDLTYSIQISYNQGRAWHTIAVNLKHNQFGLPLERIQGIDNLQVKVIASDRYNVGDDTVTIQGFR